jgi:parallel beta-helix repeat protein
VIFHKTTLGIIYGRLFIALAPILSVFSLFTKPIVAQTTPAFTCNNIYVSVQADALTNNYPVGKKFYQLDWTTGTLGAQIGTDNQLGVTGGIGIDPTNNRLYYVDGNGGGGYSGVGRIWYFDGTTHTNTGHTIADPTAEHMAGTDSDGVLWATRWTDTKNLYRYDKTGNAVSQGTITSALSSLSTEWSNLSEGDLVFDKDNKIWFVSTSVGKIAIWTIDRSTRIATKVGNYGSFTGTNHVVTGGAFGPDGKLYIGTSFGYIYKFDTATNTLSAVNTTTGSIITDMTSCMYPAMNISGKVWNDADNSAKNTFANINTGTETGTNAGGLNAILIDANGKVIASAPVAATTGIYSLPNISGNQSGLKIRLSTATGTLGGIAPAASVPAGWINTSPLETAAFPSTITTDVTGKDFGVQTAKSIAGKVFEDINYGGGVGRDYTAADNSAVSSGWTSGAIGSGSATAAQSTIVELYADNGAGTVTKVQETATDNNGNYSFTVTNGTYRVRVVNSTVRSERTGYTYTTHLPIQTFRNDSDATTPAITNEVGGRTPAGIDLGTQSIGASFPSIAQSWTDLVVGTANISGVDFGYNFDTIVNTNDSGQGSLRQFITNSNALKNDKLNQAINPNPASGTTAVDPALGEEASIFMIPISALTSNVAVITPATIFPDISDSFTTITGLTQTANIGDTNSGQQGVGGTVGVDRLTLGKVNRPEVQIVGTAAFNGLTIAASNITIQGLAIYGFPASSPDTNGNIIVSKGLTISMISIEQNFIGTTAASFSLPTTGRTLANNISIAGGSGVIQKNLIGYAGLSGVFGSNAANWTVVNNEIRGNAIDSTNKDGVSMESSSSNTTVRGNLIVGQGGVGVDSFSATGTLTVENNTITGNGVGSTSVSINETPGIRLFGTSNTVTKNIIANNYGAGVLIQSSSNKNLISQNSIYGNGTIVSARGASSSNQIGIDLLTPADLPKLGTSPYITPNGTTVTAGTIANGGMNYPVITSATIASGQLTVKGFVGQSAASSSSFAGARLEFFVGEGTNQNQGAVILGDNRSKPHGEGKSFIGECFADAAGKFNCVFNTAITVLTLADPIKVTEVTTSQFTIVDPFNITATATGVTGTTFAGNTSEFSASPYIRANVQILKRITGIKSVGGTFSPIGTIDNTNASFPVGYVKGTINAGLVKPGDEIEYTIYYVNNGENAAKLKVCDLLDRNLMFNRNGFDTGTNTDRGIQLQLGQNSPLLLTSANDSTVDRAYYASGAPGTTISDCNLVGNTTTTTTTNASGTVVIDINSASASDTSAPILLTIPGTVGSTILNDSYGLVKFRAKVKN